MVSGSPFVPGDHICGSKFRSGLVCDSVQSQVTTICSVKLGPSSCSCGQLQPGLEPMAENLSIPILQHYDEDAGQIEVVLGHCGPTSSVVAHKKLVPTLDRDGIRQINLSNPCLYQRVQNKIIYINYSLTTYLRI